MKASKIMRNVKTAIQIPTGLCASIVTVGTLEALAPTYAKPVLKVATKVGIYALGACASTAVDRTVEGVFRQSIRELEYLEAEQTAKIREAQRIVNNDDSEVGA